MADFTVGEEGKLRKRAARAATVPIPPAGGTPTESEAPSEEFEDVSQKDGIAVRVFKHQYEHKSRTRKRRSTFIFLLGSLFGIVAAGFFAKSNDLIDFPQFGDLSMGTLLDVLPAGLVIDIRDLVVR